MECQLRDGTVLLRLRSGADTDLEEWAGERAAEIFQKVYGHAVMIARERP
jgi:hypothetical protein